MLKLDIKKTFLFGAVIGLLIFLHFVRILNPIENTLIFILNPFTTSISSIASGISDNYHDGQDKQELANQVILLEKERNQLLSENVQLKIIEEENQNLRQHLEFLTENKYNYVLANVISRGSFLKSSENEQVIMIDKGLRDGIFPGLALVNSEGMIVGKIFSVEGSLSEAYLIVDQNCKLAAMIQNKDRTIGVTQGNLGLTIKMDFIPQTEEIFQGNVVVTSGLEENIPKGLVIGKVIQVNQDNNEVWQNAVIEPMVNLDSLSVLSILLP